MGLSFDSLVGGIDRSLARVRFAPMRVEDLDAVMEIERRSFPEPWTPGLFLHELKVPFSKSVLARAPHGTEVLGYVCCWLVSDEVHILNLAVRPECRQMGVGRALVDLVVQEAEATGASIITLEVRRENAAAMALYRSFGFVETGVRCNYYGLGHDAIIMTRTRGQAAAGTAP